MPAAKRRQSGRTEGEALITQFKKKIDVSVIFAGCDVPGEDRIRQKMARAIDPEEYDVFHYHGNPSGVLELISKLEGYCFVFVGPHLSAGEGDQRWLLSHLGEWYGRNVHTIAVLDENGPAADFGNYLRLARMDDVTGWNPEIWYPDSLAL